MKSLAEGEENTAVVGPSVEGEVWSSAGINCMASGSVGCDTQIGTATKRTWA
jgi:hypothetical protein